MIKIIFVTDNMISNKYIFMLQFIIRPGNKMFVLRVIINLNNKTPSIKRLGGKISAIKWS